MKNAKFTYSMILIGGALWCAAIVLAPVFVTSPGILKGVGQVSYVFFHPICHQMKDRSFCIDGAPFGVCSRCTAIYFGFFIGTLLYPVVRSVRKPDIPSRWLLGLACIPMFVDAFPWRFGMYEATLATRAISGGIAGFALAFFIVPAAIQAVSEIVNIRSLTFHQQKGISDATETR